MLCYKLLIHKKSFWTLRYFRHEALSRKRKLSCMLGHITLFSLSFTHTHKHKPSHSQFSLSPSLSISLSLSNPPSHSHSTAFSLSLVHKYTIFHYRTNTLSLCFASKLLLYVPKQLGYFVRMPQPICQSKFFADIPISSATQ